MRQPAYTVGVQVWRLPVFRKFRVINHKVEGTKVALFDELGGCTVVPGLDRKALRIYPDYRFAFEHQRQLELSAAQGRRDAPAAQMLADPDLFAPIPQQAPLA